MFAPSLSCTSLAPRRRPPAWTCGTAGTARTCHAWRPRVQASRRDDDVPEQWTTAQEIITFFTADGIVRIPGRTVRMPGEQRRAGAGMDPLPNAAEQGLCIGASFSIGATNGRDPARRVQYLGFCQSVDALSEAVSDAVTSRGGEVLEAEKQLRGGVHERLRLTLWLPFLWGVPPAEEELSAAIVSGGGILDRVWREWGMGFYPRLERRQPAGGGLAPPLQGQWQPGQARHQRQQPGGGPAGGPPGDWMLG